MASTVYGVECNTCKEDKPEAMGEYWYEQVGGHYHDPSAPVYEGFTCADCLNEAAEMAAHRAKRNAEREAYAKLTGCRWCGAAAGHACTKVNGDPLNGGGICHDRNGQACRVEATS